MRTASARLAAVMRCRSDGSSMDGLPTGRGSRGLTETIRRRSALERKQGWGGGGGGQGCAGGQGSVDAPVDSDSTGVRASNCERKAKMRVAATNASLPLLMALTKKSASQSLGRLRRATT